MDKEYEVANLWQDFNASGQINPNYASAHDMIDFSHFLKRHGIQVALNPFGLKMYLLKALNLVSKGGENTNVF